MYMLKFMWTNNTHEYLVSFEPITFPHITKLQVSYSNSLRQIIGMTFKQILGSSTMTRQSINVILSKHS